MCADKTANGQDQVLRRVHDEREALAHAARGCEHVLQAIGGCARRGRHAGSSACMRRGVAQLVARWGVVLGGYPPRGFEWLR